MALLLAVVGTIALSGCPSRDDTAYVSTETEVAETTAEPTPEDVTDEKENKAMTIDVTNADFQAQVIEADKPVLVDFWAPWCGPCQMMHPVLDSLGEKYDGKAVIARVNIDEADNQQLAMQYQIRAIPYMAIFKNGQIVEEIIGVRPEEDLAAALDKALGS